MWTVMFFDAGMKSCPSSLFTSYTLQAPRQCTVIIDSIAYQSMPSQSRASVVITAWTVVPLMTDNKIPDDGRS